MSTTLSLEIQKNEDVERITRTQFGIWSPDEIRKGSVAQITIPETYDGTEPKFFGLFDPRMGVLDRGRICPTDKHGSEICPGYFGHIELALPVYNISFISTIIKVLRCVCYKCGNILLDKSNPEIMNDIYKRADGRFGYVYDLISKKQNKKCIYNDGCGRVQPHNYIKVTADKMKEKDNIVRIDIEFKSEAFKDPTNIKLKQSLDPLKVHRIFNSISSTDCEILGFNNQYSRPEWMITTVMPVAPPAVRPSAKNDNNQRSEDDLTSIIVSIIKANDSLREKIESGKADEKVINSHWGQLQYYCASLIDNDIKGVPSSGQRGGRALKAIRERLKAKEGRLRGNLMGKRVNYSARTVISVDPNLSIDQYGIPLKIAMNMTVPVDVTKYNITELYKYVRNGADTYPGARSVKKTKENGRIVSLAKDDTKSIQLDLGDVVYRHVIDGDIALFNRQPSLHRMSMMAHRIKVMAGQTFRLNVFVTTPYNADFDGDEMNMHLPQSIITRNELEQITLVPTQIISPAKSIPIIYVIQDSLIGSYLMTQNHTRVNQKRMNNLMIYNKSFNGIYPEPTDVSKSGERYWNGQRIFETILPNVTLEVRNNRYDKEPIEDNIVKVVNGKFAHGILDSKSLGSSSSGFVNVIYKLKGKDECHTFLDNIQRLVTRWMVRHTFTFGVGDCVPSLEMMKKIEEKVEEGILNAYKVIEEANSGLYKPEVENDKLIKADLETKLLGSLKSVRSATEKAIIKDIPSDNNFLKCIYSNVKGKPDNLTQVMAVVGQQDLYGQRVGEGFVDRTLPHFHRHDIGPAAKGFIRNSFVKGLDPHEYFFHGMSGRNGVIDTAVKTADSGYTQRKIIKALEDIQVKYDSTVRNSVNNIVQFVYGDDSIDPTKLDIQKMILLTMDNKKLEDNYKVSSEDLRNSLQSSTYKEFNKNKKNGEMLENEFAELKMFRDRLQKKYYSDIDMVDGKDMVLSPVHFFRNINSAIVQFNIKSFNKTDLDPKTLIDGNNQLLDTLNKYTKDNVLEFFEMLLKSYFSVKNIIVEKRITKEVFFYLIELCKNQFLSSFIQPGEMVGVIAAQSCGEPLTQLTLNTFHSAGTGSTVTTSGMPRVKEILSLASQIKTPSDRIYLKPEYAEDHAAQDKLRFQIMYTNLRHIVKSSEIIYDVSDDFSSIEEDNEFLKTYFEFEKIIGVESIERCNLTPWVIRLQFDKEAMMNRNISMIDIQDAILMNCNTDDDIQCIFNDDNASNLVMRIRIRNDEDDGDFMTFLEDLEKCILNMTLVGIPGIDSCVPVGSNEGKQKRNVFLPDGSYKQIQEYVLGTAGSNLREIMTLDMVDETRTYSNDIHEMMEIFGIEAARNLIIHEINATINDTGVEPRHINLLGDYMTYKGFLIPFERHGINRNPDNSPWGKSSFEEVIDILVKAATFSQVDKMNGVSSNIMAGQFINGGTNAMSILVDEEKMANYLQDIPEEIDTTETFTFNELDEKISKAIDMSKENSITTDSFDMKDGILTTNEKKIGDKPKKIITRVRIRKT